MRKTAFLALGLFWIVFFGCLNSASASDKAAKNVVLIDSGLEYEVSTNAQTVGDFLNEQHIATKPEDLVFPSPEAKLNSGANIIIQSARKISISADGQKINTLSQMKNVQDVLAENNISLGDDDLTNPSRLSPITDGTQIAVTRVKIEQQTVDQPIPFSVQSSEDDTLSWRTKKSSKKE